ncbi:MAG TPA: hypothetical protein VE422_20715 [Terriglobia bacterium]|nr:hypothetical protein [Terriglobia bacterium]
MTMQRVSKAVLLLWAACLLVAPAAIVSAQEKPGDKQEQADDNATKGSKDIDQVVKYPMDAVLRAVKLGMETYGFEVKKEKPDYLEATRTRHVGVFLGSGGEKVKVRLSTASDGTRVKIETGKGFVGRLGKKNWSTPIFNETTKILAGK